MRPTVHVFFLSSASFHSEIIHNAETISCEQQFTLTLDKNKLKESKTIFFLVQLNSVLKRHDKAVPLRTSLFSKKQNLAVQVTDSIELTWCCLWTQTYCARSQNRSNCDGMNIVGRDQDNWRLATTAEQTHTRIGTVRMTNNLNAHVTSLHPCYHVKPRREFFFPHVNGCTEEY